MSKASLVRPSRDGDQFHYLWAARRCLRLLSPKSNLVAVTIEGSSPSEVATGPITTGEELIDIGEYYTSENIAQATLVRYMQLKHSTRTPHDPWTASGLEKTIAGFSQRYQELLKTFEIDDLAKKIEFWFVTNRPIGVDFADCVFDAANERTPRHPKEYQKLERFTGLTDTRLASFCKLIHFEDRQDGFWDQRNILFQDVSKYLPDSDADAPTQLKELVTKKALSETEKNPVITKMDVLRVFKTDESCLFPANNLIKQVPDAVAREQENELHQRIVGADANPIVIHAEGGVGKSVFATRIGLGLSTGSVTVLYDCFGNAQYRSVTGYRHRHKDALVQIANELAAQGLCHPLIPSQHADATAYVRAFIYRLEQAITILRNDHPDALLCVVIDAADNAQMAAEEIGEARSFALDLIREKIPDGVRFIFFCRSHRQKLLDPPINVLRLELRPFSHNETAIYLRKTFPNASERDVDEFHRLSSQNPRVQALALSRGQSLAETLRLLGPNPTTVESAIGNLLNEAISKLRDSVGPVEKGAIDKICEGLATLRPLIPIPVLSAMSGVAQGAIKSFALDLGRPLLVAGETVQFLDEPSETWFRETFKPTATAMANFIESLRPLAVGSSYVASALPQLMLEAGQFTELVALALTSSALPETSPLEKRDVELQRLQFALKATLRTGRYLDASKLALKGGGETAGDERQTSLLQANTDLVAKFIETELVQEIVSRRTFGSGWVGSHHAYEAALLSGKKELIGDARSRLRMAHEWLRNWSRLPKEERKQEEISDNDIAELAIAQLNIHGAVSAADELRRWTPREISFRVGKIIAKRLVDHGRFPELTELAISANNDIGLILAIVLELRDVHYASPAAAVSRAFKILNRTRVRIQDENEWDDKRRALNAVTALIEAALTQKLCTHDQGAALLSRYLPTEPPRGLSSRHSGSQSSTLRAYTLQAALLRKELRLNDLAYPELKEELEKQNRHHSSRDVQEFQENVGALLPWYKLWAACLIGTVTLDTLNRAISDARNESSKAARINYREEFDTSDEIALIWFEVLNILNAYDANFISEFTGWVQGLRRPLYTPTLIHLARLAGQAEAIKSVALEFSARAFTLTRDARNNAETKSETYIEVARAVLSVSSTEAKAYFNEAMTVAGKIGDENLARWDAILDLADRAARTDRPSPIAAYKLARCGELTYDYVDRDKHFDWKSTVEAIARLCPSSIFAILSRWRDRDFGWAQRLLPIAVEFTIKSGAVDVRDALPLIGFRGHWHFPTLLDGVLASCTSVQQKRALIELIHRKLSYGEASLSELKKTKESATKLRMTLPGLDDQLGYATSKEAKKEQEKDKAGFSSATISTKPEPDWNTVFSGTDLATAAGLTTAYKTFKESDAPRDHEQFFRQIFSRVIAGSEPSFIRAMGEIPEFTLYTFRSFLDEIPESWKARPAITQALAATLKIVCRRYCMTIKKSRHYEIFPINLACELASVSEADIVTDVLNAIGQSPDLFDTDRLFSLVGLLTSKLTHDEALDGLLYGLELFDVVLEDKDGDGPWSDAMLPPTEVVGSIAGYIWAGLAAPPSILRWESAHAVLITCALDRVDILSNLFELADRRSGGPFVDARLPFYEFHALQWLLIAVARASVDFPTAFTPYTSQIVNWALQNQAHVLIRALASRAAISLIAAGVLADTEKLGERLSQVNVSSLPAVESKSYHRLQRKKSRDIVDDSDDDKFYFGIDMGPYWYQPLGNIFALSQADIENEALDVIRTDFASTGAGKWDEDERQRRKIYEYDQTSHSHGSYPRTDDLRFYLSYHAMMIVAGRLLATMPIHNDTEYGEKDEFFDWLSRHDLSRQDGRWLSDRRDPTPLESPKWRDLKTDDPLRGTVTSADFDEMLFSGGMLNVWGHWTMASSDREQSAHVYSALVTPHKSLALLGALQTANDVFDYGLPRADGRLEIDTPGYELKGWISNDNKESGLDVQDYWSGGVRFPPPTPAPYIVDQMNIKTDLDSREWRSVTDSVVMASQVWGHFDLGERNSNTNPERGSRIQASLAFVMDLLKKLDRDLILQIQIERQRRYRSYESSGKHDAERIKHQAKLYLVRADGRITTL